MEMVLFIGVPGSGKSSYYQQRFYLTHLRINLDMLKTRHRERALIETCLQTRQPFVVDNTNVTKAERAIYLQKAKGAGFRVIGFFFNTTLAEALRRNEARVGRAKIPRVGVIVKFKRLQAPEIKEGFDQLWSVTLNDLGDFLVEPYPIPAQVQPSVEGSKSLDLRLPG